MHTRNNKNFFHLSFKNFHTTFLPLFHSAVYRRELHKSCKMTINFSLAPHINVRQLFISTNIFSDLLSLTGDPWHINLKQIKRLASSMVRGKKIKSIFMLHRHQTPTSLAGCTE